MNIAALGLSSLMRLNVRTGQDGGCRTRYARVVQGLTGAGDERMARNYELAGGRRGVEIEPLTSCERIPL